MPRRSSAGRPAARASPRPTFVRNPPQPVSHAPPPATAPQGRGSMMGEIGSTIAQGMAFGTGSAVAHRAVDAVLGPRTIQHENVATPAMETSAVPTMTTSARAADSCGVHNKAFQDCVNMNEMDIGKCQFYLDMLNECRRSSSTMLGA